VGVINRPYTAESFWLAVDRSGEGCWEWSRFRNKAGYGYTRWAKKPTMAHRVAYELAVGPIPPGLFVLHTCDNPPCCNPSHLWIGTKADNNRDRAIKGRGRSNPKKLNEESARLLKWRLINGAGFRETARAFGVSLPNVLAMCEGRAWKHV